MTFTTEKRLGLVGINGTGKSTFLKILAGQMEADKGTIERNGKASIHYLAQTPDFDAEATLLEAVLDGNHPRLQMVKVILTSLNSSLVPYDFSMFCKLITFIFRSYFVILLFIILHITIDSNRRPQ